MRAGGVSPGNIEGAAAVVAYLANSGLAVGDGTTVSAGEATDAIILERVVERRVGFADSLIEHGAKGGHERDYL